jgi:predicted amidohydrolase
MMDRLVHLVVVQFKPRKGDYAANLARLAGIFSQIDNLDPRPDVAVFSETALTGYFVEGGVRDVAMTAGALARDPNTSPQLIHRGPSMFALASTRNGTTPSIIVRFT